MRLSASDLVRYYSPSICRRRLDCYRRGLREAEPGAFEQLLVEMGRRHDARHRESLEPVLDLSQGSLDERRRATAAAIERREPKLFQPMRLSCECYPSPFTIHCSSAAIDFGAGWGNL